MQNPLLYFCRHFSPVNRYHKFHSIFSIRHVQIDFIQTTSGKRNRYKFFLLQMKFYNQKISPHKENLAFSPNNKLSCKLFPRKSNSFKFFCSTQRRKFSNFLSIIFSDIISQKYYSLSRIIVEKIRKEPPRICRMRVHEAPGTKCNSVYRYERQSVQAQHDSLDWNTLPTMGTSPFSPLLHG